MNISDEGGAFRNAANSVEAVDDVQTDRWVQLIAI
jgi:hypothetical protein